MVLAIVVSVTLLLIVQGRQTPGGRAEYVALGSSYAAGAGLGKLQTGSPWLCARSVGGYPQRLARKLEMPVVDMSCGGAVTRHLVRGGQFFQGPQVRVVGPGARLVTITIGGNDVGYVGDLSLLAARKDKGLFAMLVRSMWKGPKPREARGFDGLKTELVATIRDVRRRAPEATVVVATYPAILPRAGTCDAIALTETEAAMMRQVGDDLAEVTRTAAREAGALVVDMNALGVGHDACSASPWVTGWKKAGPAPFHPTSAGAEAVAEAIAVALTHAD
ncbi:SGNH/GDSL hydrolase family protein [Brevundimonas sp.]|uniref:SGNH/GDSL hydrolase family protein n=1 Tax=Brevundimonas sp. TaxID=1871086 RepID=UPI003D13E723